MVSMDTDKEPRHLILDFPKSSLTFRNENWLGIFDQKFVNDLCEYTSRISISVPAVDQITFHCGMLDNILKNILESTKVVEKCNCSDCRRGYTTYCSRIKERYPLYDNGRFMRQKDLWLNKLHFYFPDVTQVKFFQNYSNGCSFEAYNSIIFSNERLEALKKCGCKIEDIFQFYSLANCKFPQLDYFGGHIFYFEKDIGSTSNLRKCMQLLTEISSGKQDNDSSTPCKIEPFPKNTKRSTLVNWIVDELTVSSPSLDYPKYLAPWFEICIESLEFLDVKPLILEEMSAMIIRGFHLPNLKEFSLVGNDSIRGSYSASLPHADARKQPSPVKVNTPQNPTKSGDLMKWSEVDTLNELGFNLTHSILFSSLNNLSNCKDLKILVPSGKRPNFLFNVKFYLIWTLKPISHHFWVKSKFKLSYRVLQQYPNYVYLVNLFFLFKASHLRFLSNYHKTNS